MKVMKLEKFANTSLMDGQFCTTFVTANEN